jgi:chromosome partitioning protein
VGKSTLTVHLAYSANEAGLRVLLVDMDKQASLSLTFEPSKNAHPGLKASRLSITIQKFPPINIQFFPVDRVV